MAVAGDSANIPSFPISLKDNGKINIHSWATNRHRDIVECDIDRAIQRLLAGEMFNLHCSGAQVIEINDRLRAMPWRIWLWRLDRRLRRVERWQGWK